MTSPKLKVGVVGVGRMGLFHLKKYFELASDVELVGFYDSNPVHAASVEKHFKVRSFAKLADLLFEIDAASIASPTLTHFSMAKEALNAGVHVLIEKPMTETILQAVELTELARRQNLVLQVGFLERYRYRALIDSFALHPPFFIEANRFTTAIGREPSVDVVADLMIHDLDLALSLVRGEPSQISAVGGEVITSHLDIANVRMEFDDGSVVSLGASRVAPLAERRFKVYSGARTAFVDFMSNTADLSIRRETALEKRVHEVAGLDALREQALDFIRSIKEQRAPLVTGEDGIRAVKYVAVIQDRIHARSLRGPFSSVLQPPSELSPSVPL